MIRLRSRPFRDRVSLPCWVAVHHRSCSAASAPQSTTTSASIHSGSFLCSLVLFKIKVEKVTEDALVSESHRRDFGEAMGQFNNPFCSSSQTLLVCNSKSPFFKSRYLSGILQLETRTPGKSYSTVYYGSLVHPFGKLNAAPAFV